MHNLHYSKRIPTIVGVVGSILGLLALMFALQYALITRADVTTNPEGDVATTTDPVLSDIEAEGSTDGTEAIISWTTNQPATAQVGYGTTTATSTGYAHYSEIISATSTDHSITLEDLMPNTTYHFQVISMNEDEYTTRSDDMTFMTLASSTATTTPAPVISDVDTDSDADGMGATISWITDQPTNARVWYGTTALYGSSTALTSSLLNSHEIELTDLAAGTTYHFMVESANTFGSTSTSSDMTFTTLMPDDEDDDTSTSTIEELEDRISTLEDKVDYLMSVIDDLLDGDTPGTSTPPISGATIMPSIVLIDSGRSVDFNGRGFGHEEDVTITLGGSEVGSAHADGGGNFSTGSMTLIGTGTKTYVFTGEESGITKSVTVTFN